MKRKFYILPVLAFLILMPAQGFAQSNEVKTINDVLTLVLQNNPIVKSAMAKINAAKGNALQAGLKPNPNALVELENFVGNKNYSGVDDAEITVGIQQEIEIAGKRDHRKAVAEHETSITEQEAIANVLSILGEAETLVIKYTVAQERLKLINKRLTLSDQAHDVVKKRVAAAASSDIEHTKVDIEQRTAQIDKSKAQKELEIARSGLERIVGTRLPNLTFDETILKDLPNLPEREALLATVKDIPQSKMLAFNKMRASSTIDLAQAYAVPNPTVGLGVRRFNDTDSNAFLATLSIPIPVFDRNQGNIIKARAELVQAEAEEQSNILILEENAKNVWEQFNVSLIDVKVYQDQIIKDADKAYSQVSEGYSAGRFSFLDLLDAQRTLYDAQESWLNSLLDLHEAKAQADFLMMTHASQIRTTLLLNQGEKK